MSATGLVGGGLVFIALIVVFAAGWAIGARGSRVSVRGPETTASERNRTLELLHQSRQKAAAEAQAQLKEHRQTVARLEAQIIDRESTISSLRSRLYGARTSVSMLEDQLEATIRELARVTPQQTSEEATPQPPPASMHTLTFDLGEGLEVETTPSEPRHAEPR